MRMKAKMVCHSPCQHLKPYSNEVTKLLLQYVLYCPWQSFFFQFRDVAQVVIVHKMYLAKFGDIQNITKKDLKHPDDDFC